MICMDEFDHWEKVGVAGVCATWNGEKKKVGRVNGLIVPPLTVVEIVGSRAWHQWCKRTYGASGTPYCVLVAPDTWDLWFRRSEGSSLARNHQLPGLAGVCLIVEGLVTLEGEGCEWINDPPASLDDLPLLPAWVDQEILVVKRMERIGA